MRGYRSALGAVLAAAGAVVLGLAALLALATVWEWERTEVLVTSEQVLVEYGLLRRRLAAVDLARGEPVELEQGLAGRLLGYGTLVAGGLEVPFVPVHPRP
ncbi:MAG TPA: PH domain-containing protein [Planctomycetota bacterium]|nr:PH domain-containing protein [Planctomycetota bacterium]